MFDYIKLFYTPTRKQTNNGMLSPVDDEARAWKLNKAGVWETGATQILQAMKNLQAKSEKHLKKISLSKHQSQL